MSLSQTWWHVPVIPAKIKAKQSHWSKKKKSYFLRARWPLLAFLHTLIIACCVVQCVPHPGLLNEIVGQVKCGRERLRPRPHIVFCLYVCRERTAKGKLFNFTQLFWDLQLLVDHRGLFAGHFGTWTTASGVDEAEWLRKSGVRKKRHHLQWDGLRTHI